MNEETSNQFSKDASTPISMIEEDTGKLSFFQNFCQKTLFHQLNKLVYGKLTVIDADGQHTFGSINSYALEAIIRVHNPRLYVDTLTGGSVGVGESYMKGHWSCSDLTQLMRIFVMNLSVLDGMEKGPARLMGMVNKVWYTLRKNTIKGSQKNIEAHYDLGNEFFQLFLDPTMMYSSGVFEKEGMTLEEASISKIERICKKLELKPTDHLLELGTGWGGFAAHAAKNYGCRVTTTTISNKQYELAVERAKKAGLTDKITVLKEDYRTLKGHYDKIVSIEMIEAIGHKAYNQFFNICGKLLKSEGMMLVQSITIDDRQYERAKKAVDFIQRYIFPGGCLPSITALCQSMKKASDLRLYHLEDIAPHYAQTIRMWRANFFKSIDHVRNQGYSEEFIKMWEYYLCYCESGFTERAIGCVQILFTKSMCRRDAIAPELT